MTGLGKTPIIKVMCRWGDLGQLPFFWGQSCYCSYNSLVHVLCAESSWVCPCSPGRKVWGLRSAHLSCGSGLRFNKSETQEYCSFGV